MSADVERDWVGGAPPAVTNGGPVYDASGKSPQEIEEDITDTRAQLGEILDALEQKLAPRQLVERGVDMLKDTMSGNTGKLGETLRSNPLPLALIGLGLGWMAMSGTSTGSRIGSYGGDLRERVSGTVRDMSRRAGDLVGQVKDSVIGSGEDTPYSTEASGHAYARTKPGEGGTGTARSMAASASEVVDTASQRAREYAQRAGDYAQQAGTQMVQARDRFTELVEEHPLVVGGLGLLAGVVVAFLLPPTRVEEQWVGPAREELRDQAEALGRQAMERAQRVAERTVDAAVDAVKEVVSETTEAAKHEAGSQGGHDEHSGSQKSGEGRSAEQRSGGQGAQSASGSGVGTGSKA